MVYSPGESNSMTRVACFTTVKPRIFSSSLASSPYTRGTHSHPPFSTSRPFTVTLAPLTARITSAPRSVSPRIEIPSPSRTRVDPWDTRRSSQSTFFDTSWIVHAKEGLHTIRGCTWEAK